MALAEALRLGANDPRKGILKGSAGDLAKQVEGIQAQRSAKAGELREARAANRKPPEKEIDPKSPMTFKDTIDILDRIYAGDISAKEFSQQWERFKNNKPQIQEELGKLKKDELVRMAGISARTSDKKEYLVRSALSQLTGIFNIESSLSYDPFEKDRLADCSQCYDRL
jgi:hypothetical protein